MTARNRDVAGDKCVKNDRRVFATNDQEEHLAWKKQYQRLLQFELDKANSRVNEPGIGPVSN